MTRGRPFLPGQSGNPGGRPESTELRAVARRHALEALDRVVTIMRLPEEKFANEILRAAEFIWDATIPGWRKEAAEGGSLAEVLHMHLLAVKALPAPSGVPTEALETPSEAATGNALSPDRARSPGLPTEALALWDAAVRGLRDNN
jgi:hypothetical protein